MNQIMNQKLFTIEDRFYITGQNGTVIVGEYQVNLPIFKVKDEIILIYPDGTETNTEVSGLEMFQTVSGKKKTAILIKDVTKEDVQIGTEVFLKT